MPSLLYAIIAAALLSGTSLLAILLRVSPLTAPAQALPAFFASVFLTVATLGALGFFAFWKFTPLRAWSDGKIIGVAVRQGIFLALAVTAILLFHLLSILTWWVGGLLVAAFVLVEMALER